VKERLSEQTITSDDGHTSNDNIPEDVLNESDVDTADASLEDQAREIRRLKNILKARNDELEELRTEFEEERRRLLEKLGASDVKKRLSSFREQISHQDSRLAECMNEMAKIEETMREETSRYRERAEKADKEKAQVALRNQQLEAELERALNENKILQGKNPKLAKEHYAKEATKLRQSTKDKELEIQTLQAQLQESKEALRDARNKIKELEEASEESVQPKSRRNKIPSARKLSEAIPPNELAAERPTSFALSDTLFKFGLQGARRAQKKFVWFVHASGHSYIEWSDTQDAKSSKRATVMKISTSQAFVKRDLTDEEQRRIFIIVDNLDKKLVFLAGSETKRAKWFNGISKFCEVVS